MKITRALNIVIPVERDSETVYVHSVPLSAEIFERYFLVISKTFAAIYGHGLSSLAGPRVAALMLRKVAADGGFQDDVDNGLMPEIRRLTSVLTLADGKWGQVPMQVALDQGSLDADEVSEIENALVFFMVISAMHHRKDREGILTIAAKTWDAEISSQTCTALLTSLQTSTEIDNSGAKAKPSSIPS